MAHNTTPDARGLYDPANDSDACGTLTCEILCHWTLPLVAEAMSRRPTHHLRGHSGGCMPAGVGFIAELDKRPTRSCVVNALEMLLRMTHRGACGCEVNSGTH